MDNPQLSKASLVDENVPGGGIREVHEVVDVFDSVLGLKGAADFSTFVNWGRA